MTRGFTPLYSTNSAAGIAVDATNVNWLQADGIYTAPKGRDGPTIAAEAEMYRGTTTARRRTRGPSQAER
jgi:hypothetical protein